MHTSDFVEELQQGSKVDTQTSTPSLEELVFGAVGGMAEGFWLTHKKHHDSQN